MQEVAMFFLPVVQGIIANTITSYAGHAPPSTILKIEELVRDSIEDSTYDFEWTADSRLEEVCLFLQSADVQQLVEQIFSIKIVGDEFDSLEQAEERFVQLFNNYFEDATENDIGEIRKLFPLLIDDIQSTIANLLVDQDTVAVVATIAMSHRRLEVQIRSLEKAIEYSKRHSLPSSEELDDFADRFRSQQSSRFSDIRLTIYDSEARIPIEEIYIRPMLAHWGEGSDRQDQSIRQIRDLIAKQEREAQRDNTSHQGLFSALVKAKPQYRYELFNSKNPESIDVDQIFSNLHRAVILGNPGSGKSSLTQKLGFDLGRYYEKRLVNNKLLTPIHITIRDYAEISRSKGYSILDYMEYLSNSSYQIKPPAGAIEYILVSGRALVIFDGLDELLESHDRQRMVNEIESFCDLYPSSPVIVTSRLVGYQNAPLNDQFDVFELLSFNQSQVAEYSTNWFSLDKELNAKERATLVLSFMEESSAVNDLRINPLLLGLMLSIYRYENYIPQNRPELYEKCSELLFRKWDQSRGIVRRLSFEQHLKPGLRHLAYLIYTHQELQTGISRDRLISETSGYLSDYYPDRNEAEFVAGEFVDFCKGRAWVFTDIGNDIFQFTHQTFLEYFAACHLVRIKPDPNDLVDEILPKIRLDEWEVVSQLAVQMASERQVRGGDKVISRILDAAEHTRSLDVAEEFRKDEGSEIFKIVVFAVRCLDFLTLTYATSERVINSIFRTLYYYHRFAGTIDVNSVLRELDAIEELLPKTDSNPNDIRILAVSQDCLVQMAQERDSHGEGFDLEYLDLVSWRFLELSGFDNSEFAKAIIGEIDNKEQSNLPADYLRVIYGKPDIMGLVQRYGLSCLSFRLKYGHRDPLISLLILYVLRRDQLSDYDLYVAGEIVESLGKNFTTQYLDSFDPPPYLSTYLDEELLVQIGGWRDDEKFGLFVLLAILIECEFKMEAIIKRSVTTSTGWMSSLLALIQERYSFVVHPEMAFRVEELDLGDEQKRIIQDWLLRDISFTQNPVV